MAAVNDNALNKFIGELYVAPIATPTVFTRVASVRGLSGIVDNTTNQIQIDADDTGTVLKGATPEFRIEGSFLENADRDIMKILMGGSISDVAGTLVAGATQTLTNGAWVADQFYAITGKNGNGNAPTINSVTGGTDGALTAEVDYAIVKDTHGVWGITIFGTASTNLTTLAQNIVIDYDYTPNASEDIVLTATFREDPRLVVKIVADNGSGDERTIVLSDASFEGQYGLEFLDVEQAGDLNGTTFVFKGNKGSTLTYHNEIL